MADRFSMPENENPVRQMIRRQLRRRNPPGTKALYGRAVRIDPEVRQLDLRQFNARHVLPVRREIKREEGPRPEEERAVRALVKRRLVEDPTLSTEALYQEAAERTPSVEALGLAEFHERYGMPVRRKLPHQDPGTGQNEVDGENLDSVAGHSSREEIRSVFFDFARAVAGAADRPGVVRVVGDVDSYVDRVLSALQPNQV